MKNNRLNEGLSLRLTELEINTVRDVLSWCLVATRSTEEQRLTIEKILYKIRKSREEP